MSRGGDGIIGGMKSLPPLGALQRTVQETLAHVLSQRFFRDRLSMALLVAALVINGVNLVWLALHVRPAEGLVPVKFSSLTLFDALGPWYFPFLVALFALGVTLINDVFAYHSFTRSRLASFFLLITSVVVAIFSFIISSAFGVVR